MEQLTSAGPSHNPAPTFSQAARAALTAALGRSCGWPSFRTVLNDLAFKILKLVSKTCHMSQVARPVSWRSNCKASLQRRALSQALRQLVRVKLRSGVCKGASGQMSRGSCK